MSDPLRSDPSRALEPVSEAERDAKIEQMLLSGLDLYFASRYQQAIDVWTRALFLDRSHARARAYIERARSALAEGQRESEELLQRGLAAFGCGDTGTARRLLQIAIDRGAPPDEALAVLGRLDRLDPAQQQLEQDSWHHRSESARSPATPPDATRAFTARAPAPPLPAVDRPAGAPRAFLVATLVLIVVLAGLLVAGGLPLRWPSLLDLQPGNATAQTAPPFSETAPALPRRGEMALDRARTLVAGGRLHDAVVVLERVRSTDPERPDADRLLADVQKQLIALADVPKADDPTDARHQP